MILRRIQMILSGARQTRFPIRAIRILSLR